MTAQEALAKWDAGEILTSVEMGGIGPGYEQAIQIAIFEFIRRGEEGLNGLGLSGAQAGAAAACAKVAIGQGWEFLLTKVPADRHILVSKTWPVSPPSPTPAQPPSTSEDECPRGGRHSWAGEVDDVVNAVPTGMAVCVRCGTRTISRRDEVVTASPTKSDERSGT